MKLLLVNFKTYPEAAGKKGTRLAQNLFSVRKKGWKIAVAPSMLDLEEICKCCARKGPVFAQHADPEEYGAHTGHITPRQLKKLGAKGTLLNHAERKLEWPVLKKTAVECKSVGLGIIICASTLAEVAKVASLHPDYIAYEPEALIGGEAPVTDAEPEVITKAVSAVRSRSPKTKVLCGAGVHSPKDVQRALQLGAEGVLLSHAVIKARNPSSFLKKLISPSR